MPVFNNWLAKIPKNLAGSMMPLIGSTLFGIFFFFFFLIFIYLAMLGLSCRTRDLSCGMWDLLVVQCGI